jgi:aspartyl-tRNA(Asn)/glutamyl-tRNA(Gln) amidotransferase subunit A
MIRDYGNLSATDIVRRIKTHHVKAVDLAESALSLAETQGKRLNAVITVCHGKAIDQARKIDRMAKAGEPIPPMAGVPIILKDNIVYSEYPTTCGSRMLEDYISPYDATCVKKLESAGAIIVAKANMDEFAMGSSNEHSAFGPVTNPAADGCVPGGSSGGSCAAVAAGIVPVAYGSDTGGSVRQPAGFCGVVGLKPSYGAVSRYGLVAFASSTDQIGPIARNVQDCALAFEAITGYDPNDSTSRDIEHPHYSELTNTDTDKKFHFGVVREYQSAGVDNEVRMAFASAAEKLKSDGHTISEIFLPHTEFAIAAYYIIANAEASSNLARYDGLRYGHATARDSDLIARYSSVRSEGFGPEVKRRIMLGTFTLSAGYHDAYYVKARKVRELIKSDFEQAFAQVDFILSPTSSTAAFKFGEKLNDPLAMYLSDAFTIPANLAGIPAISIQCGHTSDGHPIGLQIMASAFSEGKLFVASARIEKLIGYKYAGN